MIPQKTHRLLSAQVKAGERAIIEKSGLQTTGKVMGNIFRKELIQASSDGVIDKREWQALKKTAEAVKANEPQSGDALLAGQVVPFLDSVQVQTRIGYTLNGPEKTQLQFNFSPHYSESELVPGRTPREQINYLAQRDHLPETNDESNRCGR